MNGFAEEHSSDQMGISILVGAVLFFFLCVWREGGWVGGGLGAHPTGILWRPT